MGTKAYTISMPEEIMALVDEMARAEHRSRSEMLREMVRTRYAERARRSEEALSALRELLTPLVEATADMSEEEVCALIETSVREVRDEKSGAGHQRAAAVDTAS